MKTVIAKLLSKLFPVRDLNALQIRLVVSVTRLK